MTPTPLAAMTSLMDPPVFHYERFSYHNPEEKKLCRLVQDVHIHARDSSFIRTQIRRTLSEILKAASFSTQDFNIQCHGTFLNNIAFITDDLRLLLVHSTAASETQIVALLKPCASISDLSSTAGFHRFWFDITGQNAPRKWWSKLRVGGVPNKIQVSLKIMSLPSFRYNQ
jgi:hypothetical protein